MRLPLLLAATTLVLAGCSSTSNTSSLVAARQACEQALAGSSPVKDVVFAAGTWDEPVGSSLSGTFLSGQATCDLEPGSDGKSTATIRSEKGAGTSFRAYH